MPNRNLLLLLSTILISCVCWWRAEQNPYARYVAAGYSVIDRWSLQAAPDQQLFEGAMRGMVDVLRKTGDEYSAFVSEKKHDAFREDMTQQFGGIGVRIRLLGDPALPTVIGPPQSGTPAAVAGILSGDRIVAISNQTTAEMTMDDVLNLMRGPVGEAITLDVERVGGKQPLDLKMQRAMIVVDSIYGDLHDENNQWTYRLTDDTRLGYVRITTFGDKTVEELTRVLAQLTSTSEAGPIEALIIDVRENAGGALDAAVDISDLFLRAGRTIVTTRGRDQTVRDRFVSTGNGGYTELPVAVLINQNSASASEILAACLQDYGRAAIVGQRSYGKGTVQRLMPIESGRSLLKITSATYWRPSEKNIHRMKGDDQQATWGVQPNPGFEVKLDEDEYLVWRKFRSRRDWFGEVAAGNLAKQLDQADGALPEAYVDQTLKRAVEYLQLQLIEVEPSISL